MDKSYLGSIGLGTGWVLLACPDSLAEWDSLEEIVTERNFLGYADYTPTSLNRSMLLWYVEDAGNCDIFSYQDIYVLIASWLMPEADETALEPFVKLPNTDATKCGNIECDAGYLVASWAVEPGEEVLSQYKKSENGFDVELGSIGKVCLPFSIQFNAYDIYVHEVENEEVIAKILYLVPDQTHR